MGNKAKQTLSVEMNNILFFINQKGDLPNRRKRGRSIKGLSAKSMNNILSLYLCILGYFPHSARMQKNGSYRTVKHPQTVYIHPTSRLAQVLPRWVVYHKLMVTTKEYM
ncbi:protein of unknown function DUF1605 [Cynara cardunculus var. scolymus]|uniref:DEAD-box helicase OB fold domain-containing protein n=1 Tax=Cynara cardunculus var. scolymus TaxID=59895 RepID=A0A118K107_CYNCS|nr:protein of unknown function DUF1605 [Cynara cardunculus var. scolymus]